MGVVFTDDVAGEGDTCYSCGNSEDHCSMYVVDPFFGQ
jgi:hypothetical protein